jgi:hypothetical protein
MQKISPLQSGEIFFAVPPGVLRDEQRNVKKTTIAY